MFPASNKQLVTAHLIIYLKLQEVPECVALHLGGISIGQHT